MIFQERIFISQSTNKFVIMQIEDFIKSFAEQFEDTDPSEIKAGTKFHDLEEWSSMIVLAVIAMVNINYDVTLTGQDIKETETVEELFNMVKSRQG